MTKDITKTVLYKKYSKYVNSGVRLLNKKLGKGKWEKQVRVDMLQMSNGMTCVIGQVFGSYFKGIDEIKLDDEQAVVYGFQAPQGQNKIFKTQKVYDILQIIWVDKLTKLQAKH